MEFSTKGLSNFTEKLKILYNKSEKQFFLHIRVKSELNRDYTIYLKIMFTL